MSGDTFVYSFTHSSLGTSGQIAEKLTDLSQGATSLPYTGDKGCFTELKEMVVKDVVISERHVAMLTQDGRICRLRYSEETTPPQVVPPSSGREKSDDEAASTTSTRSYGSRSASPRLDDDRPSSSSIGHHVWSSVMGSGPAVIGGGPGSSIRMPNRGRILLRRTRGGGHGIVARWPMIPSGEVPDEIVDQAMAVLQGKSREMVIRELQRTNLDVNQAVNNLLSREDDDGEGSHDESSGGIIAASEDLLSLLGPGLASVGEEELDEVLRRPQEESSGRDSRLTLYEFSDPLLQNEIRTLVSIGDGAAGGSGEGSKRSSTTRSRPAIKTKKSPSVSQAPPLGPALYDSSIEWWAEDKEGPKFKLIAGLSSELLAVDSEGKLHGWSWSSPDPSLRPHPLETRLELSEESVRLLSARLLRGSLVTESGKIATFVDSSVGDFGARLQSKATPISDLSGDPITSLTASELVSAIATESGKIYWWGVLPFTERKNAVSQSHEKLRALKYQNSHSCELVEGSKVCLRSTPVYASGTKAIYIKPPQILCGILQEDVLSSSLSEKCTFKIVTRPFQQDMEVEDKTSSDQQPVSQLGTKRKYSEDEEAGKTAVWALRDVVFTEHVPHVKEGTVVKIDGNYAAVHYPPLDASVQLSQVNLESCRLLRKDELVLVSEAAPYQSPYFIQDSPRKLRAPPSHSLITMATDSRGLHCLFTNKELVQYIVFNLDSGKILQNSQFGLISSQYLIKQGGALRLVPINLSVGVVMDQHGGLFPVSKNNTGNIKDLQPLNLPPVSCVGAGSCSERNILVSVVFSRHKLMSAVLGKDLAGIKTLLGKFKDFHPGEESSELCNLLTEHCSGGCNVFHVLGSLARPADPAPVSEKKGSGAARSTPRGLLRDIMKQAISMASNSRSPPVASGMDWSELPEGEETESQGPSHSYVVALDMFERLCSLEGRSDADRIFRQLMTEKNVSDFTPFMAAMANKSYGLALQLLGLAQRLCEGDEASFMAMLHPPDSHPDDNPVFILTRNDSCSFTWTGDEHVQQDIFECRTCGLINSLCCCTECAYTCHRGHDCFFKKASPTAYCDCSEMGKCHSLAAGSDFERKALLEKLLKFTELGTKVNGRGEHLLTLLASTVARQGKEQSHWSGGRFGSSSFRRGSKRDQDVPIYNLPPPRFAIKALNVAMENWRCVRAVFLCGAESEGSGHVDTASLDSFTYLLLAKLNQKVLDSLLVLLVGQLSRPTSDGLTAANRFLRSVARIYTLTQLENTTAGNNNHESSKKRSQHLATPIIERAQKIFASLASLAVRQLVPMAKSLMVPVMMGVAKPVNAVCMSERGRVCEEVFRLPLVSLLREGVSEEESGETDMESELGEEDQPVLALDASSTLTTGSHLLYLSDQDSSDDDRYDGESVPDDASIVESHDNYPLLEAPPSRDPPAGQHWALPRAPFHSSRLGRSNSSARDSLLSMGMSASLLAQTFNLMTRQLAETLDSLWDHTHSTTPPDALPVGAPEPKELYDYVWAELEEVWVWLFRCMDHLQIQLQFGDTVNKKGPKSPLTSSKHEISSEAREHRKDVFSYMLTLFRGSFGEHGGRVPTLDVAGLEHVAWTFDSLYYLLQNTRPPPQSSCDQPASSPGRAGLERSSDDAMVVDEDGGSGGKETELNKPLKFFHRSNSTLCLGSIPHSPFDPLVDVLPLAEKPQLMDSVQDKQVLFGYQSPVSLRVWPSCSLPTPPIITLLSQTATSSWSHTHTDVTDYSLSDDQLCGWNSHMLAASILIGRWDLCLELFARAFMDSVGKARGSVLAEQVGFEQRDKNFRREMDFLRASNHKEIIIEVDRSRDKFLTGLFHKLNHFCEHQSITGGQSSTPLLVHRLKVTFTGEQGEGSGVLRSMFTVAAEAVLSEDPAPPIDMTPPLKNLPPCPLVSGGRRSRDKSRFSTSSLSTIKRPKRGLSSLDPPLFYQPGKVGFYSPRVASNSPERLNAYRNIGRLVALCLLHTEVMTLPLCRHVFKFLLKRDISWHDLAFFDPGVYESLRKMILDSRKSDGESYLSSLGLTFSATLRPEEGGSTHDLVEGGSSVPVTPGNVLSYVKEYAMLRMVIICREPLEQIRDGLYEVLPENTVSHLSAEDLRLLLCGCPHIDVEVVRSITAFDDESRKDQEQLTRFKGWFWAVLERMTQRERQDLLYFWTSSPVLPANVESYTPPPSVTIRPPDDQHLPTANTCISRLYVPLYSSKAILRTRLLTAIKTKAFGFV